MKDIKKSSMILQKIPLIIAVAAGAVGGTSAAIYSLIQEQVFFALAAISAIIWGVLMYIFKFDFR